ncbi:uncharacterized protein LY79DRAFT_560808 [Colletotrichum navitas]|uniref:Uncharacterized protein n=1 Tax=Colletotrichum navitas TaxID=681940 RepID=A0AAD8V3A4_9PEZI|nr:uncharacterized protein LY79DRAFT_560808 [Colletotrichum navitas]KAK1580749.1 hypothetical protein LY79DRAFT_560808 [Colletotrichum navitas]
MRMRPSRCSSVPIQRPCPPARCDWPDVTMRRRKGGEETLKERRATCPTTAQPNHDQAGPSSMGVGGTATKPDRAAIVDADKQ